MLPQEILEWKAVCTVPRQAVVSAGLDATLLLEANPAAGRFRKFLTPKRENWPAQLLTRAQGLAQSRIQSLVTRSALGVARRLRERVVRHRRRASAPALLRRSLCSASLRGCAADAWSHLKVVQEPPQPPSGLHVFSGKVVLFKRVSKDTVKSISTRFASLCGNSQELPLATKNG